MLELKNTTFAIINETNKTWTNVSARYLRISILYNDWIQANDDREWLEISFTKELEVQGINKVNSESTDNPTNLSKKDKDKTKKPGFYIRVQKSDVVKLVADGEDINVNLFDFSGFKNAVISLTDYSMLVNQDTYDSISQSKALEIYLDSLQTEDMFVQYMPKLLACSNIIRKFEAKIDMCWNYYPWLFHKISKLEALKELDIEIDSSKYAHKMRNLSKKQYFERLSVHNNDFKDYDPTTDNYDDSHHIQKIENKINRHK